MVLNVNESQTTQQPHESELIASRSANRTTTSTDTKNEMKRKEMKRRRQDAFWRELFPWTIKHDSALADTETSVAVPFTVPKPTRGET